jgi:hypothetical protein
MAQGSFFPSFNAALIDLEASFREDWSFNGATYPAIAIDRQVDSSKEMKGGNYDMSTVSIYVRKAIHEQAGCREGDIVEARGKQFAILSLDYEGDDSVELVCGPYQIDVWER